MLWTVFSRSTTTPRRTARVTPVTLADWQEVRLQREHRTVLYNPAGFHNQITDSDDHSLTIIEILAGCTPGFWQGGSGRVLWDQVNDPDWVARGGDGFNPFIHTTLFNSFFTPHACATTHRSRTPPLTLRSSSNGRGVHGEEGNQA